MKHLVVSLFVFALTFSTFGCGDNDEGTGVSCQSAMAHFYAQSCEISVGMPLTEAEAVGLCEGAQADAQTLGGSCPGAFDAYLACLATIADQACGGCDAELTALDPCMQ